ncbi:replication initiation protein RepC, partial [Rhizobium sp. VS19-DR104.2]
VARIPRSPDIHDITPIVEEMEMLREEVLNLLEVRINVQNMHGNESQAERHIQNSNPDSNSDLEPASDKKQGETSEIKPQAPDMPMGHTTAADESGERKSVADARLVKPRRLAVAGRDQPGLKAFPLGLVLQACPEILSYGPGGSIGSWRDLMAAAVVVRSMLGVSPSAYEEACVIMGPENAATVMACVLERAGSITSAGGYLRDLTRRTERGEFAIGPMLMSLARANAGRRERTG